MCAFSFYTRLLQNTIICHRKNKSFNSSYLFQLFSNIDVQESHSPTNFNSLEHRGPNFECPKQGENTLSSPKILVTSIIFM